MTAQGWEWLAWGVVAFIATTSLIGLMRSRHRQLMHELLHEAEQEQVQRKEEQLRVEREAKKKRPAT
jgi:hypothetical protein